MKTGKLQRMLVDPYLKSDEHVCPKLIKDTLDEAKKDFPKCDTARSLQFAVMFTIEVWAWKKKWIGESEEC